MKKIEMSNMQKLCVACLSIPVASFMLGIASAYYPKLVIMMSVTGGLVLWLVLMKSLTARDVRALDARSITGLLSVVVGGVYGYLSGIVVGSTGNYVKEAIVISFSLGIIAAILYRSYYNDLARYGEELEEQLQETEAEKVKL